MGVFFAASFMGQTSWHLSHPQRILSDFIAASSSSLTFFLWVSSEKHTDSFPERYPQTSIHLRHPIHSGALFFTSEYSSLSNTPSVRSVPIKTKLPYFSFITSPFFPRTPRHAFIAASLSFIGDESQKVLKTALSF